MTSKDKQDVISVCRILADKMSDSGKVAVQQIIGAVEDMVENEPCEDCISREEALRVAKSYYHAEYVVDKIRQLPSVTPQQSSVTDFYDKCKECGKILNDKLQTRWIPVSERLPEEDGLYLVIGLGIYLGEYSPFIFKREKTSPSNTLKWVQEIVAWMPLPQPYKAESEE